MSLEYLNKNGLVDGRIPAGKPCAYAGICPLRMERCPTKDSLREVDFSCASARYFSLFGPPQRDDAV